MIEELRIADVTRIRVKPGDVIVLRLDELPVSELGLFEPLEMIQAYMKNVFPDNRTIILDRTSDIEVIEQELDYDLITHEVLRRFHEHAKRS